MPQIPLDLSGRYGVTQYASQSLRNAYAAKDGQAINGVYNPFVRYGWMSPPNGSSTAITLDQTQNATMGSHFYDPVNNQHYLAEVGQQMFTATSGGLSFSRDMNLAGAVIRDIDAYMVNGVRKMFVMYNNGSNQADISMSAIPYNSATSTNTYLTATVSGAFTNTSNGDFFMTVADNGFAYLFMENQVHKLDGTAATGGANGTVTPNALLFPVGYRMVDALDYVGLMWIAVHNYTNDTRSNNPAFAINGQTRTGIYIWDRQTTIFGTTSWVPLPGFVEINKIFLSPTGKVRVLAVDTNGYTQLLQYDGTSFNVIFKIGFNAKPLFRDSVTTFGQMNAWMAKDGNIYLYGPIAGGDKEGLYILNSYSVATTTGGLLVSVIGTSSSAPAFYICYSNGSSTLTNISQKVFTITGQMGSDVGLSTSTTTFPVKFLPVYSSVHFLKIPCIPTLSSGAATAIATINVYINHQAVAYTTKTVYQLEANTGMIDIPINKVGVWAIQVDIAWAANTLGADDFCISSGYVDYDPIVKRK